MSFRRSAAISVALAVFGLLAGRAASQELNTGLVFTPQDQLLGIPLASSPYAGTELPPAVDLSVGMPPPGDQGHQNSCVAWAVAYALKSYQENVELHWGLGTSDHVFSPAFIYNQINNGADGGSSFADALNLVSSRERRRSRLIRIMIATSAARPRMRRAQRQSGTASTPGGESTRRISAR